MAWENVVKQTAAGWTANNPTLLDNQIGIESNIISGVETDSGAGKIGNGVTPWNSLGYSIGTPSRVYRALLTQTGTDAPVATVLENTLGGTVVWTRSGAGDYQGTLSGAFTANKTVLNSGRGKIAMEGSSTYLFLVGLQRVSNNLVSLFTTRLDVTDLGPGASSQDEILGGDPESPSMVEILVYP